MTFSEFSIYLSKLDQISSRLHITEILAELFTQLTPDEIESAVNLSLGQLRPKFDKLELNLADKMVMRGLAQAFEKPITEIQDLVRHYGDIGSAGEELKQLSSATLSSNHNSELSLQNLYDELCAIAQESGTGSQDRKLEKFLELMMRLDPLSVKMVIRIILGKLRLGYSDMTVLDALSWMATGSKEARTKLEDAYQLKPDIGSLAKLVKMYGIQSFAEHITLEVGVPIIPALAQRLKTADEMILKMGEVSVDPKYDGTRVQIHLKQTSDGETFIKTFTRNLDESSPMFPELIQLKKFVKAKDVILDCEAIGYDAVTGQLLPFQITIQRKRKHNISDTAAKIPLKFFVFDILYKDGQSLINTPLSQRYAILQETITDSDFIEKTKLIVTQSPDEVRKYHAEALAQGLESAMVKKWHGNYQPGRKGWNWVKFKEAEGNKAKLSDTVDAVVMGLYAGEGKRTQFGVGAFLIGVKTQEGENKLQDSSEYHFVTISKVGTGLTDEQWIELKTKSLPLVSNEKPAVYQVPKELEPDIWLSPSLVVEVAADEITTSPIHSAGKALRFPRLIKFREDKEPSQATTLEELNSF